jgi:hypothetical protein
MFKSAANRYYPDPTVGRRAFVKGMVTAVVAVGAGALACGTALAATQGKRLTAQESRPSLFPFPIPPAGVEIPCSMYAANVPLQLGGNVVMLDFKGGIRYRVETSNTDGLKMSVQGFKMIAVNPVLGTVTLEQSDSSTTPLSTLSIVSDDVPRVQLTTFLDLTLTVENQPGGGQFPAQTLQPMVLVADNLLSFPPQNLTVNLQEPVPFGTPDATTATLTVFPATMNTSPA